MPSTKFGLIYSTFESQNDASDAATILLNKRLIACAVFLEGNSLFWWKGRIDHARETILLAKTPKSLIVKARAELEKIHPYETPCILTLPAEANALYLKWAVNETTPKTKKK